MPRSYWGPITLVEHLGGREINIPCPAITPTLGAEVLPDPGLEAAYTAGLCNSLTKVGSPILSQSANVHGGARAQAFQGQAAANRIQTTAAMTIGSWYQASIWGIRAAGASNDVYCRVWDGAAWDIMGYHNQAAYTQLFCQFRATGALTEFTAAASDFPAAWDAVIVDDMSLKPITLSSMLYPLGSISRTGGLWSATPTVTNKTLCGFALRYRDADNFLLTYVSRVFNAAYLVQRDAGTYSILRTGAITYGAAKTLAVAISGATAKLYYDGAQVGADATITATGLGYQVQGFSTYASNAVGTVQTAPA